MPIGGEDGGFTLTSGRERGVESEVVETGRCSVLELCCSERGPGGPVVAEDGDTRAFRVVDHGEGIRGMSSGARSLP